MAAPIAHLFLATQMLSGPLAGRFNHAEFLVGTSFPDIRYLNVIKRSQTHTTNVTLTDIMQEKDSFKAGMLFHAFVDIERERYMVMHEVYKKVPKFNLTTQGLKLAEDLLLMPYVDSLSYVTYFDRIFAQEKIYEIDEKYLWQWHIFLREYLKDPTNIKKIVLLYFNIHYPDAWCCQRWFFVWYYGNKFQKMISDIVNNQETKKLLLDFYLNFVNHYSA